MYFRPLPNVLWNIFLALVPVLLSFVIVRGIRRQWHAHGQVTWGVWIPLLFVWLAFLPNTCYLLTEWRHYLQTVTQTQVFFQAQQNRDATFDLFLETGFYVFYTGTGLLTLFLAVWPLDRLARRRLGRWVLPAQALVFAVCALGVYLGLVCRFNSWDLVHTDGFHAIAQTITEVFERPVLLGLIGGFGLILWFLYALFDIWMDGAALRLHARRARRHPALPTSTPDDVSGPSFSSAAQEDWHHASL
jgi:uncharacterized membrane protein